MQREDCLTCCLAILRIVFLAAMSNFFWESSRNRRHQLFPAVIILAVFAAIQSSSAQPVRARMVRKAFASRLSGASASIGASGEPQAQAAGTGISGRIVDSATRAPISGGETIVALEQPDGTGTDAVFTQAKTDSAGRFAFERLPQATTFDLVVVAVNAAGVGYAATVVVGVPPGTELGDVPLIAESGQQNGTGKIEGLVTATSGTAPSSIRATVSAIQTIGLRDGASLPVEVPLTVAITAADYRPVTIPGERGTSADIFVRSRSECPASAPTNVNCARYVIVVPGSNPSVARFERGKIAYEPPAAGPARYSVRGNSFMPFGAGASVCIPSFQSANSDEQGQQIEVSPGGTATAQPLAFSGCW